ncbi:MAG: type II toxin-antitoxin system HicB family antitoxin [Candidatus Altiarchaeota archaeon]
MRKFKVLLEPDVEGGYTVQVLGLPGCFTEGDTKEEALANARDAITLYIEHLKDKGKNFGDIPKPSIVSVAV